MDEIETMKAISERFEKLSDDERERVLAWAIAKYGCETAPASRSAKTHNPSDTPSVSTATKKGFAEKQSPSAKPKSTKKAKSIISMDKTLNLTPSGKKSAVTFAGEKAPANVKQKCVVAVYYLRDVVEVENIAAPAVYTFFKTLGWPVPADLKNTLQQAGTEGWLDTSDSENIKLTSMGENVVEHSLPPKTKA